MQIFPASGFQSGALPPFLSDPVIERFTTLAARSLGVPLALVRLHGAAAGTSVVAPDAQRYVVEVTSLGALAEDALDIVCIEDGQFDMRTAHSPAFRGAVALRFFAAAPVRNAAGAAIGSLIIADSRWRSLREDERSLFATLATLLGEHLELGTTTRRMRRIHESLERVTRELALATGDEFFQLVLRLVVEETGMQYGWIAKTLDASDGVMPSLAQTLALYARGGLRENMTFDLEGSPCAQLMTFGVMKETDGVADRYPDDHWLRRHAIRSYVGITLPRRDGRQIGWMALLGTEPLVDDSIATMLLQQMANRVATELDRRHFEHELRLTNQALEARVAERTAALESANVELRHDAFHDELTGLPNRALFMDRLGRVIERTRRHPDVTFAVFFIDLDRFKIVNDSLGHQAGDELLVKVAERLHCCIRPEDTVARFGGDEFTVLLESVGDVTEATRVAERILERLAPPITVRGHEIVPAASIGIAHGGMHYDRPDEVVRDADTAMYRAKAIGRTRFEVFDDAMHAMVLQRLQTEAELRLALERSELRVHYQPIVSLATRRPVAFEALVRWQHPVRGLLPPGEFLRVAEDAGLLDPIDRWLLGEACRQARAWNDRRRDHAPIAVSVNVTASRFERPELVEQIVGVLQRHKIDGRHLRLEITETVLAQNAEAVLQAMDRLRELDVRLFVDDFGTGYSSLSYLHRFPIHTIKIDGSFVSGMPQERNNVEIVRTIVTLAHTLGMEVVAEGVETDAQMEAVRSLGCEHVQGFAVGRPVPAHKVTF